MEEISSEDRLFDFLDIGKLREFIADPDLDFGCIVAGERVISRIEKRQNPDSWSTFLEIREYFRSLKVSICGVRHENRASSVDVLSCKIRCTSLACLHSFDHLYKGESQPKKVDGHWSEKTSWVAAAFVLTEFLVQQGYELPRTVFKAVPTLPENFTKMDGLANTLHKKGEPTEPVSRFQGASGRLIMAAYIEPLIEAFDDFWEKNITPITTETHDSAMKVVS